MEKNFNFDVVILENPIKYSRFSFKTALTNVDCLLEESMAKTQKNLAEYFKEYGPIFDHDGNSFIFKDVTMAGEKYHLNFIEDSGVQ